MVVTTGAISRAKLQSNHHHQQTNIQFFYRRDALPVQQCQSTEGKNITFHGLAYPRVTVCTKFVDSSFNQLSVFITVKEIYTQTDRETDGIYHESILHSVVR